MLRFEDGVQVGGTSRHHVRAGELLHPISPSGDVGVNHLRAAGFTVLTAALMVGCRSAPAGGPRQADLQAAIDATMADARRAIQAHGPTERGMAEIAGALRGLSPAPGLVDGAGLRPIHGNTQISQRVLASDGPEGINLYLTRLEAGAQTPVHDHSTWGVVYVLKGRDRHVRWQRLDDGADAGHASLRSNDEQVVTEGNATYWLAPPHDIHSQQAAGDTVWELVMTGRDLSHATASGHRHWYDVKTGAVSHQPQK